MHEIVFNGETCRGCGTCAAACPAGLIRLVEGHPARLSSERCRECFHCVAACPSGAAEVCGFLHETAPADSPFLSRRSCRSYAPDPVDRAVLAALAVKADQAPRVSRPTSRRYVYVTEPGSLANLRNALVPEIHKARALFRLMASLPLLPRGPKRKLREYLDIFEMASRRIKTGWDVFHGAPIVVLVTGSRAEGMNKEDGVYAMQQLLLLAEASGLGGCVNGFIAGFPRVAARALGLPKKEVVWAAATLGYPRVRFNRVVLRKDLDIQWR